MGNSRGARRAWGFGAASLVTIALSVGAALAEEPLTFGKAVEGTVSADRPEVYRFAIDTPGALAMVLRADDGVDASVEVTDPTGQLVLFGRFDGDWYQDVGSEQGVITLDAPGEYRLFVESSDGSGGYRLMTALLPLPEIARPEDPQGSPSTAMEVTPGQWVGEAIRPVRGDWRDWYRLEPTQSGVVTAMLRGEGEADFVLVAYAADDLRQALVWADNDDQGRLGWETLTFDVTQGHPMYLRITTRDDAAGDYRLLVGYVGGTAASGTTTESGAAEPAGPDAEATGGPASDDER